MRRERAFVHSVEQCTDNCLQMWRSDVFCERPSLSRVLAPLPLLPFVPRFSCSLFTRSLAASSHTIFFDFCRNNFD